MRHIPAAVTDALAAAIDTFNEEGYGILTREDRIDSDADWKTQLTKACRLLAAVEHIAGQGFYTAMIELCFGGIERFVEAYALAEGGDELDDFQITPRATSGRPTSACFPSQQRRNFGSCTTPTAPIVTTVAVDPHNDKQKRCSDSPEASTSTSPIRLEKAACACATPSIPDDATESGLSVTGNGSRDQYFQ